MIKFVIAAIWIVAVTVGSIVYSFQSAGAKGAGEADAAFFGGLDYVKTNIISVPILKDGHVGGYFLTRLVYTVEADRAAKLSIPAEMIFTDEVHSYLFANPQIDFTNRDAFDYDAFKKGVIEAVNARVGEQLVHEILVEQIDFLSKEDIRDNTIRRRKTVDTDKIKATEKDGATVSH